MGQRHKRFRESRTPFPLRDFRKNPRSMYARVPQAMAQFVLKIEKLSHIMGPTPILEMARAYGLRPRLWLLFGQRKIKLNKNIKIGKQGCYRNVKSCDQTIDEPKPFVTFFFSKTTI